MKISDFDYNLPDEKIAIYPPEVRGSSRLLVLHRKSGELEDKKYSDISDYLNSGDVLVLNETKVIKARLEAEKVTGGKVEIIVLEKHVHDADLSHQKIMYRGRLKIDDSLKIGKNEIIVKEILGNGIAEVSCDKDLYDIADNNGEVPLPPYMHREAEKSDEERYQTVFAKTKGSVAAPTASLNFTDELKQKLLNKGVKICYVTLHVGLGTFLPVREDEVENHQIHTEYFEISNETIDEITKAKIAGKRVVALGTTVTRTLEYCFRLFDPKNKDLIYDDVLQTDTGISGEADIFIYPGFEFKVVDVLITNFHAPRSTVLLLANAFAGVENLKKAYDHALQNDYMFLSYGDSMLII